MARSKCLKLLQHSTEDASHKSVPLKGPHDPGFTSRSKLTSALSTALNAARTPASAFPDMAKLGITRLVEANANTKTLPFRMGIALVDLTGSARLAAPEYAGFNDTTIISCGSIFKLAPILAGFQLRGDVQWKFAAAPAAITDAEQKLKWAYAEIMKEWTGKGLSLWGAPNLRKILAVNSAGEVDFDPMFRATMMSITAPTSTSSSGSINEMNAAASRLLELLHWSFVASTVLQTGITNEVDGGLWVCGVGTNTANHWICDLDGKLVTPTTKSTSVQQATAVSLAKYLSLITQERLISAQLAKDMRGVLHNGDLGWFTGGLAHAHATGGSPSNLERLNKDLADNLGSVRVFGKHGAFGPWAAEALGVERDSAQGRLRYVFAALTEQRKPGLTYDHMLHFLTRALLPALDGVIVANNTP
jgi:hypothetical protein